MAKKYQSSLSEQKIFESSTLVQHEETKKNITILPELESLIPPLSDDEKQQLEANILQAGCREPLLIWPTSESKLNSDSTSNNPVYVLVDGHNRFGICKKHNLDFPIHFVYYKTLHEIKGFMIDNQLGRRNLSTEQLSYLRGMKYLNTRQDKGKYLRLEHKDQNDPYEEDHELSDHKAQNDPYAFQRKNRTTAELLAEEFNVAQATIKRDAEFAQGLELLTPDLKFAVLSGKTKIGKNAIQQLGKSTDIAAPFNSVKALEEFISIHKSPEYDKPATKPIDVDLINQLSALVPKLNNPKKRKEICQKLIAIASRLQELS